MKRFSLAKLQTLALSLVAALFISPLRAFAGEADLKIPDLHNGSFPGFFNMNAWDFLFYWAFVIVATCGISLYLFFQIKKLPAHKSMLEVANVIFHTCSTYLIQQGKFLLMLFVIISLAMIYY